MGLCISAGQKQQKSRSQKAIKQQAALKSNIQSSDVVKVKLKHCRDRIKTFISQKNNDIAVINQQIKQKVPEFQQTGNKKPLVPLLQARLNLQKQISQAQTKLKLINQSIDQVQMSKMNADVLLSLNFRWLMFWTSPTNTQRKSTRNWRKKTGETSWMRPRKSMRFSGQMTVNKSRRIPSFWLCGNKSEAKRQFKKNQSTSTLPLKNNITHLTSKDKSNWHENIHSCFIQIIYLCLSSLNPEKQSERKYHRVNFHQIRSTQSTQKFCISQQSISSLIECGQRLFVASNCVIYRPSYTELPARSTDCLVWFLGLRNVRLGYVWKLFCHWDALWRLKSGSLVGTVARQLARLHFSQLLVFLLLFLFCLKIFAVVLELLNHFLHPSILLLLDAVMISLLIIPFLILKKLVCCLLKHFLTPLQEGHTFGLFLFIVDSFHKLQSTVAGNPIVSGLMFEQFEVFLCPGPCFRAYFDCSHSLTPSIFRGTGIVGIPISIGQEPSIFRRFGREIFPRNRIYCQSAYLNSYEIAYI